MAEPSDAARLRHLFEGMTGQAPENVDLDEMRRILRKAGLPVESARAAYLGANPDIR